MRRPTRCWCSGPARTFPQRLLVDLLASWLRRAAGLTKLRNGHSHREVHSRSGLPSETAPLSAAGWLDPGSVALVVRLSTLKHCYRIVRRACASVSAALVDSSANSDYCPCSARFPRSIFTLRDSVCFFIRPRAPQLGDAAVSQRKSLAATQEGNDASSSNQQQVKGEHHR